MQNRYDVDRTLAATSDCIIFLFLGMVTITETHELHWTFIALTIAFCTVYRHNNRFYCRY